VLIRHIGFRVEVKLLERRTLEENLKQNRTVIDTRTL
jgi:hypothetical protein